MNKKEPKLGDCQRLEDDPKYIPTSYDVYAWEE